MFMHKHVIITPVRDEEKFIEKTINSMLCQTCPPKQWVIVDDGSTDETGTIIDRYQSQCTWITVIHRVNRGFRKNGIGVMEAFYEGYAALADGEWDFISKIDGDLSFGPDYFERCFMHFDDNDLLGIAGGEVVSFVNNHEIVDKNPAFHVRGAAKTYKRECWNDIGGLYKLTGWDTLDEMKAAQKKWKTRRLLELKLIQHKLTGSADGTWKDAVKNGLANYISGYHPLFMAIKCIKRVFQRPYIIMGIALFLGYIKGYATHAPKVDDRELIKFIHEQQIRKLLFKKNMRD